MNTKEKALYHQIHPLKLLTDWGTAFLSLYFFWLHDLATALVIAFVPSLIASFLLMRSAKLEKYKNSAFGRYLLRHMTSAYQAVRMIGFGIMVVAAWFHWPGTIILGFVVILFGWFKGKIAGGGTDEEIPQKIA